MARPGVTYDEVVAAAMALMSRAENPSVDRVREELGDTGSKTTIARHLKDWREQLGARRMDVLPPALPDALIAPLEQLYAVAVESASEAYVEHRDAADQRVEAADRRVAEVEARLNETKGELTVAMSLANERAGLLEDQKAKIESLHQEAAEARRAAEARLDEMRREHEAELEENRKTAAQVAREHREETDDLKGLIRTREHELELAQEEARKITAYHESQEAHYVKMVDLARQETEKVRDEAKARENQLNGQLDIANRKMNNAFEKLSGLERELGKANGAVASMKDQAVQREETHKQELGREEARSAKALEEQRKGLA